MVASTVSRSEETLCNINPQRTGPLLQLVSAQIYLTVSIIPRYQKQYISLARNRVVVSTKKIGVFLCMVLEIRGGGGLKRPSQSRQVVFMLMRGREGESIVNILRCCSSCPPHHAVSLTLVVRVKINKHVCMGCLRFV